MIEAGNEGVFLIFGVPPRRDADARAKRNYRQDQASIITGSAVIPLRQICFERRSGRRGLLAQDAPVRVGITDASGFGKGCRSELEREEACAKVRFGRKTDRVRITRSASDVSICLDCGFRARLSQRPAVH